jgi:1-acyl-sn-glycerol-3-phosphate acyltransferase
MATRSNYLLVSAWFWISLFLFSGILFPVALLLWLTTVLFDRRRYLLHQFTCRWSDFILLINPQWKVTVHGREKFDPRVPYVIVANHQSGLDILVLFKLHTHFKWVAKKDLFAVPFIGWNMFLNGYIPLERERGRSKLLMMDKAAASIRKGNPVVIFPEGTRSTDGKIKPYKTGAFRLALETGSPILPVAIRGTFQAVKKGGLLVNPNQGITLTILDPVPFESFSVLDPKEVACMIHAMTANELAK